jgi:quinoprotein glucose dehydrogenase
MSGSARGTTVSSRWFAAALAVAMTVPAVLQAQSAQDRMNPDGEWRYQSADAWGTSYSPANQINASNFNDLEVAWIWRADNFGPVEELQHKATPQYFNGGLYTVAGHRRTVVSLDPATGETLWTYREPNTQRWERSMRQNYGKGVATAQIDGRDVLYVTSPAFFLTALDAATGRPLEGFGDPVPLEGFPQTGVVDMLVPLLADWGPWLDYTAGGGRYDPDYGIPRELGYITTSSPPIVVNDIVVVGNSAEQGYNQTRVENVPGDILAFDARTGEHLWKFHIIPRPGEFGHETWENDAWQWTGDVSSWAPMSADYERGIVYIPTNPPTIDYFGGFRPGANLFGTSVIALDVETGERVWHFQTVHNDQWNYDLPNVPMISNLTVDGQQIPAVIQTTKTGLIYAFNRETGEPIWPIEEIPVPQTDVPGNWTNPTQPMPTWPEPMEPQGLAEDRIIDWTPELRAQALELLQGWEVGNSYMPRMATGRESNILRAGCDGGLNITSPAAMDPSTGIMYVSSGPGCGGGYVMPGAEADVPGDPATTGTTISQWVAGPGAGFPDIDGLPLFKPPYQRISAYNMNTGERIWWVPIGEVDEEIRNHPALQGVDTSMFGGGGSSIQMVSGDLLVAEWPTADGPALHAYNKLTGEKVGEVALPGPGEYGMMTYIHEGRQYIIVQTGNPARLVTLTLP